MILAAFETRLAGISNYRLDDLSRISFWTIWAMHVRIVLLKFVTLARIRYFRQKIINSTLRIL